ncbi:interleukin-18 receptor accessory protein-like [Labrus bergylta]|uniref:interleukin-18 receptor accessory protein-like n=1 Tax=Labrus bergylta TaxID=56723 RepID=UPI0033135E09
MQTGYFLSLLIFPNFFEACCVGNHQNKWKVPQQNTTHHLYRAVEGEIFMMPCIRHADLVWSRIGQGREGNKGSSIPCGREFLAEDKHSGNYSCLTGGSKQFFHLQVLKNNSLGCVNPEENSVLLLVGAGSKIHCPGFNCSDDTDAVWYKGNKKVSEQRRASCQKNGVLHLCQVKVQDEGVYFCDRQIIEQGVKWTFRRAVTATAVPHKKPRDPPRIMYPDGNMTEEAELGQSHMLTCKVYFPFEHTFSREVRWYMHDGGNMERVTLLHMEEQQQERVIFEEYKLTRRSIIKEVTPQHLNNTYTCIATNSVGNSSITIKLKKKIKVQWPSLVGYPIASLLLVGGLGIILHVKWLELQLIYRSHLQSGKHDGEEKEFDVFLSFVWSDSSTETEGVLTLSSQSGPDTDEEVCLSSFDLLNSEGKVTHEPLEVLFPQVLEEQWGYRLCLLERDVLPGGAYTNDVVFAIQRSRMLICFVSADYLSNSNAVFVLESGVQALLQNSSPKLLLIWANGGSAALLQPDPPLPVLVQRALKVLPSLDWTSGKPARASNNFWKSLRKAMPDHRE